VRKVLSATHFKEVRSGPALRDTCILHRLRKAAVGDGQIRTRVTLGLIREGAVIRLGELTRRRADVEVEHTVPQVS
jgi:hypothetical protein